MYGVRVVGKRGIIYTTKELEDFELMVGKIAEEHIPEILNGYHCMYLRVYQHGKKWIDIDNVFKTIQDSLDNGKKIKRGKNEIQICKTGIKDDKLFQLIIGERIIVGSAEEQKVEILIAPYEGLFRFVDVIREAYGIDENYFEDLILPEIGG
jgi:Holliday junction resolvase RusA-like endonuclease